LGDDSLVGDSHSIFLLGVVSGAGNDLLLGGPGIDGLIGDSEGLSASGAGGNDIVDLGPDGGAFAIGDHAARGSANGAGNDKIEGGALVTSS
jgi:hypothetical protein